MNQRKWEELVDLLDQRFDISNHNKFTEPLEDDPRLSREVDRIEFSKDGTKYRVDRIDGPAIIDKKTVYHKVGASTESHYVYDPVERSARMAFYRQSGSDSWEEIKPEQLLN